MWHNNKTSQRFTIAQSVEFPPTYFTKRFIQELMHILSIKMVKLLEYYKLLQNYQIQPPTKLKCQFLHAQGIIVDYLVFVKCIQKLQ